MKFGASAVSAMSYLALVVVVVVPTMTMATFQSRPRGATYASSMAVGPGSILYYTGITYNAITHKPHCFLATSSDADPTDFVQFEILGNAEATATGDSCRSVAVLGGQEIALVGTADPQGYFRDVVDSSETVAGDMPQLGFGMTLHADSLQPIKGTVLSSFARVPYPQAVVGDLSDPEIMYVASMTSDQDTPSARTGEEFPNWSRLFQHGTTFGLTVQALALNEDNVHKLWIKFFPVDDSTEDTSRSMSSVHVGGMIHKPGVGLVIAGSTAGKGEAFGPVTGEDTDGFVTILNPETGALHNANGGDGGSGRTTQRFGSESFDIVTNLCDDPWDENAFYIVGATVGDMNGQIDHDSVLPPAGSFQAFLRKVNANTLEAEWTVQLPAYIDDTTITSVEAYGCAVNKIGSVFVVGQVKNGAGMVERTTIHTSKGGTDIWIARIDTVTAERLWIQQVGSVGEDHVARNGGVVVDADGNAIVYGNTNGGLYRDRAVYAQHDLFVIRFDESDGNFAPTLSGVATGTTKKKSDVPPNDSKKQLPLQEEQPLKVEKRNDENDKTIKISHTLQQEQSVKVNPVPDEKVNKTIKVRHGQIRKDSTHNKVTVETSSIEMAVAAAAQKTIKIMPDHDPVDTVHQEVTSEASSSSEETINTDGTTADAAGPAIIVFVSFLASALTLFCFVHRGRKVRRRKSASSFDGSTSEWYVGSDLSPTTTPSRFGVVRARRNSP